ncbi:N(4)-(Beta-N-acetylglucosaminyl)-L-asparaginase-like [Oppia nitens]|uniref:N(4)-(Beta-N-acetylglucosaminyl)-L-asparaginase- like n=1 Tax=Oppia nitens TaxID=1686743 RepID=UPI0023DA2A05|nr:N(4)-(Beta-N-acetylglucosaminyl)-L-asparaginase-like [Oppia nitens]
MSCETMFLILIVLLITKTDTLMANSNDSNDSHQLIPLVINTWNFMNGTQNAWLTLQKGGSAVDAIENGCSTCEREQCDHTVGWGGSPDENGETTLDAMIMDGPTHKVGAVAGLRRVKDVISVARKVLENTEHSLLVGDLATNFAVQMGFKEQNISSDWSEKTYQQWKQNNCQPNYWRNVEPDPKTSCGPYKPVKRETPQVDQNLVSYDNHDTIGMVVIDSNGNLAVGTSTNGLRHKIPGRVGDSPIPGSGAYVDQDFGGAAATGDGDIIMLFLPSYQAVENLRNGMSPKAAANEAIGRIIKKYPKAQAAIVVADKHGTYAAACINIDGGFPYSVSNPTLGKATLHRVDCLKL